MDGNSQDDSDRDDSSQRAQYGDDDERSEGDMPPQDEDRAPGAPPAEPPFPAPFGPRPPFPPQLRPPGVPVTYNQMLDMANQESRARPLAAPMGPYLGHGLAVQGAAAAATRAPYNTSLVAIQYTAKVQGILEQREEESRRQQGELRNWKEQLRREKQDVEARKRELEERERAVAERERAAAGTGAPADDNGDGDEEMAEASGNDEPESNQDSS